jgi:cytochrome c553
LAIAFVSLPALAADAPPGRAKASACAACHGTNGISTAPDAPNLAGQPAMYLAAQLKAFRSGKRQHEVMNVMARPLGDDDIAQLADWYASIAIEARVKP